MQAGEPRRIEHASNVTLGRCPPVRNQLVGGGSEARFPELRSGVRRQRWAWTDGAPRPGASGGGTFNYDGPGSGVTV